MRLQRAISWTTCALCALGFVAGAQTTTRVSVSSAGVEGNGPTDEASISADGRMVAFRSFANNLVPGDTNNVFDVFVHDRLTAVTVRASVSTSGAQANSSSSVPAISADGRWVVFRTSAALVPEDTNFAADIYVRDLQTSTTTRASVGAGGAQGNGLSLDCSISGDGRFVAFSSSSSNLVANDVGTHSDVFVRDRQLGTTTLVSLDSNGVQGNWTSSRPVISADGRSVAFESAATNLDPADTLDDNDIYVRDLQALTTELISVSTAGPTGSNYCSSPAVSADGRYVCFTDGGGEFVPGDSNSAVDVLVRDTSSDTTTRVSVSTAGAQACCSSVACRISADGRWIAFSSLAYDIAPGDPNTNPNVFVHDQTLGTTLYSDYGVTGALAEESALGALSGDGRFVVFSSDDPTLVSGDTNGMADLFVRDRGAALVISSFCFGDGLDAQVTTPCPCANFGAPGHGCGNSHVATGALLAGTGVVPDEVQFTLSDIPLGVASIYLQGDGVAASGIVFGDGLRCAAGALTRLGLRTDDDFDGGTALGPASGDAQIHVLGHALAGNTYAYQAYYRNPNATWCPPATFNVSQAVAITW